MLTEEEQEIAKCTLDNQSLGFSAFVMAACMGGVNVIEKLVLRNSSAAYMLQEGPVFTHKATVVVTNVFGAAAY